MNAYFACHAHAHALHLCSLTRSVQCFQQLRDDGVVEQSASQSGYGAAIKHCDQPVVFKLNPFLFRNQVAGNCLVSSPSRMRRPNMMVSSMSSAAVMRSLPAHGTLPSLMAVPTIADARYVCERNPLPSCNRHNANAHRDRDRPNRRSSNSQGCVATRIRDEPNC